MIRDLVRVTSEISDWLAQRIEEFVRDDNEPEYLRAMVSRYRSLPLLIDWTGFWGLRADGEILLVNTEDDHEPIVESDARIRRVALFQGARKYRELEPLLPERPATATDCPHCEGNGAIDLPGIPPDKIVCYCGGFGWIE